jgi:hypothetical protein
MTFSFVSNSKPRKLNLVMNVDLTGSELVDSDGEADAVMVALGL